MSTKSLLIELLVEELPPKSLKKLGEAFAAVLTRELSKDGMLEDGSVTTPYATPRRLAAHITNVREKAPNKRVRKKLMPVSVAFEDGSNPTAALKKRLEKESCTIRDLVREMEGNAEFVFLDFEEDGWAISPNLHLALRLALSELPIPKVMEYQLPDGWSTENFVRPAHKLVALHGSEIVEIEALGLNAGRETQGHRFEASVNPLIINSADSYAAQLETEGAVVASFAKRREQIATQLAAVAAKEKLTPIVDDALLDEVTALVERPNVLAGTFEKEFLQVPQECLILTMKANQKYFPLLDGTGKLSNKFLIVSNIHPADSSLIVGGNERVIRARLADAKFFFDQDRKKTLASRLAGLDKVVYHNKLGSQGERTLRVRAIAKAIAQQLGGDVLAAQADQAAMLAKADLTTDMVGEFPELQGIMGRYYAQVEGIGDDIAFAIEDHYKPRFAGDELPRNMVGVCVALADKLETLVGMFGIGQVPTGDKDPFALRRHALGVIRMLIERDLPISLLSLIDIAQAEMPENARGDWAAPLHFVLDRAHGYFEDRGFPARAVNSVLSPWGAASPLGQLPSIVEAATAFIASPEGQYLAEANKRITNILKKSGFEVPFGISPRDLKVAPDTDLFQQDEERALFASLLVAGENSLKLRKEKRFAEALSALVPLSQPTKEFFDKVMVNVEQLKIRDNRITLLQHARAYMNQVADLSLMAE